MVKNGIELHASAFASENNANLLTSGIQPVVIASAQSTATASGLSFGTEQPASANALLAKELSAHAIIAFLVLPVS